MYWWVDVWSSDGCMFFGFPAMQLFTLPSSQATNGWNATLPSCQAAKLQLLRIQAVKLQSSHCCKLQGQPAKQPSCTLAACTPCRPFLVMLHTSCNIHKHVGPLLGRSRPGSRPIQTRSRPQPASIQTTFSPVLKRVIVWVLSFLQLLVRNPLTLELMSKVARVLTVKLNPKCEHCTWSSWNRSLHLSMWPLVKPQTHVDIWCHIMKTWSSSCCLGNLWIMSLYVTPSFQTSGSPRDDPEGF